MTEAWQGPLLYPCHVRTVEIGTWAGDGTGGDWGAGGQELGTTVGPGTSGYRSVLAVSLRACAGSRDSPHFCSHPPHGTSPLPGAGLSWPFLYRGEGTWPEGTESLLWVTRQLNYRAQVLLKAFWGDFITCHYSIISPPPHTLNVPLT